MCDLPIVSLLTAMPSCSPSALPKALHSPSQCLDAKPTSQVRASQCILRAVAFSTSKEKQLSTLHPELKKKKESHASLPPRCRDFGMAGIRTDLASQFSPARAAHLLMCKVQASDRVSTLLIDISSYQLRDLQDQSLNLQHLLSMSEIRNEPYLGS